MNSKTLNLEAIQLYTRGYVSSQVMDMPFATIEIALSYELDAMVMYLRRFVYGDYIDEQIITKSYNESVPATWWDAFKLSAINDGNPFFKKEKIKYRLITVTVDVALRDYWAFPDMPSKYYPKDLGKPVRMATFTETYRVHD